MSNHRRGSRTKPETDTDLKKENTQLRRQVARLRKQLERQGIPEEEIEESPEEKPVKGPTCKNCGSSDLFSMTTPGSKQVTICRSCRKRV